MITERTRLKMKRAATQRWVCQDERAKQAEKASKRIGQAAARSKTWSLESPVGTLKLITGCSEFCRLNNLSYSALKKKALLKDSRPVLRGASKGWSVLACTDKI